MTRSLFNRRHPCVLAVILMSAPAVLFARPVPIGPGCGGGPRAQVESFTARSGASGISAVWFTRSELNTISYQLSRSPSPTGPFTPISGQISRAGTDTTGATYDFLDPTGAAGDYYLLTETEVTGSHGPCTPVIKADEATGTELQSSIGVASGQNPNYPQSGTTGPPYEAIIITPAAYVDSLQELRSHWENARHLSTRIVTIGPDVGSDPEVIRNYIISMPPQLSYVLLVADADDNASDQVRTFYRYDHVIGEFATDAPYGDRDGDGLSDIAVGRWPVHDSREAAICARKSIKYDQQDPATGYRSKWTGFTNDHNINGVDPVMAREAGDAFLALTPPSLNGVQYRQSDLACCYQQRKTTFINAVNAGTHVLWGIGTAASDYNLVDFFKGSEIIGHACSPGAAYWAWALDRSRFQKNHAYGFWFPLSCDLGKIDDIGLYDCDDDYYLRPLAENFLVEPGVGPVTWFAPTRETYQEENDYIGREILSRLVYGAPYSIGQVCVIAAKNLVQAKPRTRIRAAAYNLLGDPTIRMAWSDPTTEAGAASGILAALSVGRNPAKAFVDFRFSLSHAAEVNVVVYDVGGRVVRKISHGPAAAGLHLGRWDGRNEQGRSAASGIYLLQLRMADQVLVRKVVLSR